LEVLKMGRKPRIEFQGAIYHICQRGNNRRYIFQEPHLKQFFLDTLFKLKSEMGFEVFAYAIMSNHNHMLIQTNNILLSHIMRSLNSKFSKYYNLTTEHENHVFGQRYTAVLITNVPHLLWSLKYVHQNPVVAGICQHVSDYRWNSDFYYRSSIEDRVNSSFILDIISSSREQALKGYDTLMNGRATIDFDDSNVSRLDPNKLQPEIPLQNGDTCNLFENYPKVQNPGAAQPVAQTNDEEPARPKHVPSNLETLDDILKRTIGDKNILALIIQGDRSRKLTSYKKKYILEAFKNNYTPSEIASKLNSSSTVIYRLLKKVSEGSK
jgi:putative transposase